MGFVITKIIVSLISPPASPLIIMALGFIIIRAHRVLGRLMVAAGFFLLYAFSIGPVSQALLKPLETGFAIEKEGRGKGDAIVVLGGGVRDLSWLGQTFEPSSSTLERVVKGITIYRKLHLQLVFVGGSGDLSRTSGPDADAMAHIARELGVPARDIMVENKSRNTVEGARALKNVIKGTDIILVTSASHLRRASAMFIKQGYRVVPVPTGYRYEHKKLSFLSFIPGSGNLADSSTAISEYVSLFWYSMNGVI
jgi:uncharacterized SAM-binding protein YcdF (DUF218 family)